MSVYKHIASGGPTSQHVLKQIMIVQISIKRHKEEVGAVRVCERETDIYIYIYIFYK